MTEITFFKSLIGFEFKRYNIASGYHSILIENNTLIIKSSSNEHDYSKFINIKEVNTLIPYEVGSVVINPQRIDIIINFLKINEIKMKLYQRYPKFYFNILLIENYKNYEDIIYEQLISHQITNDTIIDQELFDNIVTENTDYYCQLANINFAAGIISNYNNKELIKFMLSSKNINIEYFHLNKFINYGISEWKYVLNYIKLIDGYENYLLLKNIIINNPNCEIIALLLLNFTSFTDGGIITDLFNVLNNQNFDTHIITLDSLLTDKRITKIDLIDKAIEYRNERLYNYLISTGYKVNQDHSNKIARYKLKFKI